mgnify:CR=1 FL=1
MHKKRNQNIALSKRKKKHFDFIQFSIVFSFARIQSHFAFCLQQLLMLKVTQAG